MKPPQPVTKRRSVVLAVLVALGASAAIAPAAVATSVPEPAAAASSVRDWNQHAVAVLMTPADAPEPGARSDAAGHDVAPGDGPRGDLRRRQRDRRRVPAVPPRTAGSFAVGVTGCSSGDRSPRRTRRTGHRSTDAGGRGDSDRWSVRRGAGGDSRRHRQDRRDRRRGRRRGGDARGESRRRSLRAVLPPRWRSAR